MEDEPMTQQGIAWGQLAVSSAGLACAAFVMAGVGSMFYPNRPAIDFFGGVFLCVGVPAITVALLAGLIGLALGKERRSSLVAFLVALVFFVALPRPFCNPVWAVHIPLKPLCLLSNEEHRQPPYLVLALHLLHPIALPTPKDKQRASALAGSCRGGTLLQQRGSALAAWAYRSRTRVLGGGIGAPVRRW